MIIFPQKLPGHADQSGAFDHLALSLGRHGRALLSIMLASRTFELRAQAAPQMMPPPQCRSPAAPQRSVADRTGTWRSRAWVAPRNAPRAKGDPA